MELSYDTLDKQFQITLKGAMSLGARLDNVLTGIPARLGHEQEQLENLRNQQAAAEVEVGKLFPQEAEITEKNARFAELDAVLSMEDSPAHDSDEVSEDVGDGVHLMCSEKQSNDRLPLMNCIF